MHHLLLTVSAVAIAATVFESLAQSQLLDCGADDRQCLADNLRIACRETDAAAESCLDWVTREVETSSFAGSPEWMLTAARGYFLAADQLREEEEAERLRERSRAIFHDVLLTWPDSQYAMEAHMGLATIATIARDIAERISSLRNALRIEPGRRNTMVFLANALVDRGENRDLSEAADLYRSAYLASGDTPLWTHARAALELYASIGEADRAAAFRDEISRDSGMAEFADEIASEGFAQDLERAAAVLETACNRYIVAIFGPGTCETGIDKLVQATRTIAVPAERRSIADVATVAMTELSVSGAVAAVTAEERNRRDFRFGAILQEWIASGAATARVYVLWAQNPNSSLSEGIAAFERAVELAPDNGQYHYWLAQGYIWQGRFDEGIEHLMLARDTLPENVGLTPDIVDGEISRAELARGQRE